MNLYCFDFEVLLCDWIVVFQDTTTREFTVFHNDGVGLKDFMLERRDDLFVGFNSKNYDRWILQAACTGWDNTAIKGLNDFLIAGGNGWDVEMDGFRFNNVDIRDDMQMGLSLKAIEGHLGMSIEESTVPFDLDRPLTAAELKDLVYYCKHDVEATAELVKLRKDYLETKIRVGGMAGLEPAKALSMTNAKLTAAFLGAKRPEAPRTDERQYRYPDNLKREYIPQVVFDFFDRMYDPDVSDEELFSSKLETEIGGAPAVVGFGGIHSAIPHYFSGGSQDGRRVIRNFDVASYYPHLMTVNAYLSRNIRDPKVYADMLEKRIQAKRSGDKATANALKLIANTTYGASLNQYNDLYDPLMARSVCVSGQLYLIELSNHLYQEVPGLSIVQTNTDGIMVEFDLIHCEQVKAITDEWQRRTGFTLEEDAVKRICQKDVNGYVEVADDGSVKKKGGYLVRGIAPVGAFNVNNNAVIVAEAISEFFVNGTLPEVTINACNDVFKFQLIAKAGSKYKEAYHIVDGEKQPVQKVNRVYATKDERYGRLFKVKAEDDSNAKIESLPEHCIIDNTAVTDPRHTAIDKIDKSWYIQLAKKRIDDFYGIKPEKKVRNRKMPKAAEAPAPMNVYQKLLAARVRFLDEALKKNGKNIKLKYTFFELDDIVPMTTAIFNDLHLIAITQFTDDMATMLIVDCDNPSDAISFTSPMRPDTSGLITNEIQKLGSVQTYLRRYLYMTALDIVEADQIEERAGQTPAEEKPQQPKPKAPATPVERQEIKAKLANGSDQADEMQLEALKTVCRKLAAAGHKDEVVAIAQHTENFTKISRADCEKLITGLTEALSKEKEKTHA